MLRPKVHVCLVYNTATSNITPALDPDFRPEEVVLVHGPQQRRRADCLESVLRTVGVDVSRWPLDGVLDVEHVRERVLELLSRREGNDLALNASGGTRPMVVGAYEVFRELGRPIFYVHPETDVVSWLHRRDLPSFNCADRMKLPAFLCAHGAVLGEIAPAEGIAQNLRRLTDDLVRTAGRMSQALAGLNWLAQKADNPELVSPELDDRQLTWAELHTLIERFAAEGLVRFLKGRLQFRDEAARSYVNGGWLEQHVFGLIFGLRKEFRTIQDVGRGVEFARHGGGKAVKNELDVVFLANNRCYIIECKTKRFKVQASDRFEPDTPGAEVLYKLDTLKWLLGEAQTRAMLVSYRSLARWDLERAQDLGIATCTGRQLVNLEARLRTWISSI